MLNVRVDMGKLHCGMQTQQWNNGLVKNVTHNAHCQGRSWVVFDVQALMRGSV